MRLIDADALLEKLIKTPRYFDLKFDIDNAPTIDICKDCDCRRAAIEALKAEAEWIPCNERLPEKSEWYVVTVNVEDEPVVYLRWYSELHGWNWDKQNKTIAWMPLPEPYKEDGEA